MKPQKTIAQKTIAQKTIAHDGIPMPLLSHRWSIDSTLPDDMNEVFRLNLILLKLDLVNGVMEMVVEQPLNDTLLYRAIPMIKNKTTLFTLYHMNGKVENNVVASIGLEGILKDHEFQLDYSNSAVAKHKLCFKVRIIPLPPTELN